MPSWAPAGFENFLASSRCSTAAGFFQTRSALSDCDQDSEASQRGGAMRNSFFFFGGIVNSGPAHAHHTKRTFSFSLSQEIV